jgi:glutathione synthase/RimK-type ligase-like ATP-grasp enzyme
MAPRIIQDNDSLFSRFEELKEGDVIVGRIRLRPGEEHLLLDLEARGIHLVPSATAQLCSRSKVFQARILHRFMVPGTAAVYDLHDLMRLVTEYGRREVDRVVCKLDRANAGQGILLFASVEDVYSQAVLGGLRFPFIVQPFVDRCRDIRAVFLGEHVEAYERRNPGNFRHNLHCGGSGIPWKLGGKEREICRQAMERAGFLYAHVDLLVTPDDEVYLNEMNLRGGLRGATIGQQEYLQAVDLIHSRVLAELQKQG